MAKNTKSVLVLSAGDPIEVQESVEELQALVAAAPAGELSFFRVTDYRGTGRWINTRAIVEFHEPPDFGGDAYR